MYYSHLPLKLAGKRTIRQTYLPLTVRILLAVGTKLSNYRASQAIRCRAIQTSCSLNRHFIFLVLKKKTLAKPLVYLSIKNQFLNENSRFWIRWNPKIESFDPVCIFKRAVEFLEYHFLTSEAKFTDFGWGTSRFEVLMVQPSLYVRAARVWKFWDVLGLKMCAWCSRTSRSRGSLGSCEAFMFSVEASYYLNCLKRKKRDRKNYSGIFGETLEWGTCEMTRVKGNFDWRCTVRILWLFH